MHAGDFGQQFRQQPGLLQQLEGAARGAFGEQFGQFLAQAFGRDLMNLRRGGLDGGEGRRLDGVIKARGKSHGANHAQLVFAEAHVGLADGADDARADVLAAADEIEHLAGFRVEHQAVDGEVAAADVFLGRSGIFHAIGMAAVGIADVGAKRGHFDLRARHPTTRITPKRAPTREAAGKKLLHALRARIGGHVVIGGSRPSTRSRTQPPTK